MIWPLSQWKLLVTFFLSHVLLLSLDLITDFMSGYLILHFSTCQPSYLCKVLSHGTYIFIFLPSMWAFLALLWSLVLVRGKKIKACLVEFIFELPFCNIVKKLQYFLQLCFLDSTCPHNFALVSEIHRQAISASVYEAFLESVPQVMLQVFFMLSASSHLYPKFTLSLKGLWQITSFVTSFASCCLASINLYVLQRPRYYGDSIVSFKVKLIYLPLVALAGASIGYFWLLVTTDIELYAVLPLLFGLIFRFTIASVCCKRQNRERNTKSILNETVSSWFAPFVPWTDKKCANLKNLLLNLTFAAIFPMIIIQFTKSDKFEWPQYYEYSQAGVFPIPFLVCLVLLWIGDYNNLFQVTKIFKVCCMKPVVHRSIVIDWLKNQKTIDKTCEESLTYPDFFELFVADSRELNQPELENWNTVLHFAFKENQFEALTRMIQNGGNPFVRNKEGESVNLLLESLTEEQAGIKEQLKEAIKNFEENFPCGDQESFVHCAARNNQLKLLKRYKFLQASFDSYNNKRQKPVEIAMESGQLEVAIYLMENTFGFFLTEEQNTYEPCLTTYSQEPNLRDKCREFLSNQAEESLADLRDKYPLVFETLEDVGHLEAEVSTLGAGLPSVDSNDLQLTDVTDQFLANCHNSEDIAA